MQNQIMRCLIKLRGPQHHKGFKYAIEAVSLILSNDAIPICEIYNAIASKYQDTPYCVERNLRTYITATWKDGCAEEVQKLGCYVSDKTGLPVNKEFICAVANAVRLETDTSN